MSNESKATTMSWKDLQKQLKESDHSYGYSIKKLFNPKERYYELSNDPSDCYDTLVQAMRGVLFYNELDSPLANTLEILDLALRKGGKNSINRQNILEGKADEQFEVFWMLLVQMFGDYGTSPRNGWINYDRIKDAMEFIELLLEE